MPDIRNEKTRSAIKEALIALMETQTLDAISVTSLTKRAGVSRSTFYSHFRNTYEVHKLLVADFLDGVDSMESQVKCSACLQSASGKPPYCLAIRNTVKYRNVVRDRQYVTTMLHMYCASTRAREALLPYLKLGLDERSAENLLAFQITGCHMVALQESSEARWPQEKRLLDTFIAGGMDAIAATCRTNPPQPSRPSSLPSSASSARRQNGAARNAESPEQAESAGRIAR